MLLIKILKHVKKAILLALIISVNSNSFSQAKSAKAFGFLAGGNLTKMNFYKSPVLPTSPYYTSFQLSLRAGVTTRLLLGDRISLVNEYVFSQINCKVNSTGTKYNLNYISLPVLMSWQVHRAFFITLGSEVSLLIKAQKVENGMKLDITHDTEERSLGVLSGLGFDVAKSISCKIRYVQGINHIGIGQRSNLREFKFDQFQGLISFYL